MFSIFKEITKQYKTLQRQWVTNHVCIWFDGNYKKS